MSLLSVAGREALARAVMASQNSAKALLTGRFGVLGGMASAGAVHPFVGNHLDGEPLGKPVYTDWH